MNETQARQVIFARVDEETRRLVVETARREHRNIGQQLDVIVRDWALTHPVGAENAQRSSEAAR